MTWQQITALETEESRQSWKPNTLSLTLENKDGEAYEVETDYSEDGNSRGREGITADDVEELRDALDDEAWANINFDGRNAVVMSAKTERPDSVEA